MRGIQPVIAEILVLVIMAVIAATTFNYFKSVTVKTEVTSEEAVKETVEAVVEDVKITSISGNKFTVVVKGKIENPAVYGDNEKLNISPTVWEEGDPIDVTTNKVIYDPYSKTKAYNKIVIITPRGNRFEREIEGEKVDIILTYNQSDWDVINGTWNFGYFLETT